MTALKDFSNFQGFAYRNQRKTIDMQKIVHILTMQRLLIFPRNFRLSLKHENPFSWDNISDKKSV